jgi:hypothetical protein
MRLLSLICLIALCGCLPWTYGAGRTPDGPPIDDGLRVLGLGYGPGSKGLKAALKQLGYEPYHMETLKSHPEHVQLWSDLYRGADEAERRREMVRSVFRHHSASVDFPGAPFWREIVDASPNHTLKLILTVPKDAELVDRHTKPFVPFRRSFRDSVAHFSSGLQLRLLSATSSDGCSETCGRTGNHWRDRSREA